VIDALAGSNVFVTGATGFIGSHLARRLLDIGARVNILIRPGSTAVRIADRLSELTTFEGDLSDVDRLRAMLKTAKPQYVFHLAAYTIVDRDYLQSDSAMRVNLGGTMRLTEALQGIDLKRLINTGTCEEYGDAIPPFDEDTPLKPVSPYSVSKAAATMWCQMIQQTTGAPIVTVRPFLCYGAGQDAGRLVTQAIIAALAGRDFPMTEGEQTRDFKHVTDFVDGYLRAAVAPAAVGEVINLGSGEEHRVRDLVQTIFNMAGARGRPQPGLVPYRQAEVWRSVASITKARRLLGWEPKVRLEDGMRTTIEWYREQWAEFSRRLG
jgi:UDP-glucose 4-epimerase